MNICIEARSVEAIQAVLSLTEKFDHAFHKTTFPRMCSMAIHAFAALDELQRAEETFQKLDCGVKWSLTPVLVMPENVIRVMESLQPFLSDSDVCRDDDQNGA